MKGTYLHFTIDLLTFPTLILNVEISFLIHSDLFFDAIDFSVRLTDRFTFDVLLASNKVNSQYAHALQHSLELVGCIRMASQDRADETAIQSIRRFPNCFNHQIVFRTASQHLSLPSTLTSNTSRQYGINSASKTV